MSWDAEPHVRRKPWNPRTEMAGKEKKFYQNAPFPRSFPAGCTIASTLGTTGSRPFSVFFSASESNSSQPGRVPGLTDRPLLHWGGFELKF